jgi:UDP-N-acetyl-D-mannosaminuronic acid dehydrogenase
VDDIRESPALEVVHRLQHRYPGRILISDPFIPQFEGKKLPLWKQAVSKANIVVLLVNHKEYCDIPASVLRGKTIIDTRGVWRSKSVR